MNNDQLKLNNGQVVNATFLQLDSEGDGKFGKWYKYSLIVDNNEVVYFANDNQKPIFENLKNGEAFSFGKIQKEGKNGTYYKIEKVDNNSNTASSTTATTTTTTSSNNTTERKITNKEASIIAGVAVKVAGWSISPSSFSEQELYVRSLAVLSVINRLEHDLLNITAEELFA